MKNSTRIKGRSLMYSTILFSIVVLLGSCSKDNNAANPAMQNPGNPNEVLIQGFAFNPSSISVPAGTKVTWLNYDSMTHTVTSDNALFDSGNIAVNGSYSFTFTAKGTYGYHCSIHSGMKGTVVVN